MRTETIRRATNLLVAVAGAAVVSTAQAEPRGVDRVVRVEPNVVSVPAPQVVKVPIEDVRNLRVRVWTDAGHGSLLFPGEDLTVRFRADEDAYVVVYDIDTQGRLRLLFPESPHDDGFVRGGRTMSLPGRHAGYRLMVTGPAGVERIVALASSRPLVGQWRRLAEDDLARLSSGRAAEVEVDLDARFRAASVDLSVDLGSLSPELARVPSGPRVVPVPWDRRGMARDETWFRVGRSVRGRR